MATDQEAIKLYIPAEDAAWLRAYVKEEGRTQAGVVRMLLRRYRAEVEATSPQTKEAA
jgi:hypothetical protein